MPRNDLTRFFIVFALISSITLSFSACARMGSKTGGAGPVSMQQQQQQANMQQQQQFMPEKSSKSKESEKTKIKKTQEHKKTKNVSSSATK